MQAGLQTFVHLLNIGADRDEMNVFGILVNVIAENLLALFVYDVNVVYYNDFFLSWNV